MNHIITFFQKNSVKILITIIVALILDLLSNFPYLGALLIFPYPIGKFFALWIFITIYFRVTATFTRILALFWLSFALITALFRRDALADSAGVASIMLMGVGFIQEYYEAKKRR